MTWKTAIQPCALRKPLLFAILCSLIWQCVTTWWTVAFFSSVIERKYHEHIKIPKEEKSMRFLHWHSKILNLILKYLNFQSNIFFSFIIAEKWQLQPQLKGKNGHLVMPYIVRRIFKSKPNSLWKNYSGNDQVSWLAKLSKHRHYIKVCFRLSEINVFRETVKSSIPKHGSAMLKLFPFSEVCSLDFK